MLPRYICASIIFITPVSLFGAHPALLEIDPNLIQQWSHSRYWTTELRLVSNGSRECISTSARHRERGRSYYFVMRYGLTSEIELHSQSPIPSSPYVVLEEGKLERSELREVRYAKDAAWSRAVIRVTPVRMRQFNATLNLGGTASLIFATKPYKLPLSDFREAYRGIKMCEQELGLLP